MLGLLLGTVLLIIAIVALHHPRGRTSGTRTTGATTPPIPTRSSTSASPNAAPTASTTTAKSGSTANSSRPPLIVLDDSGRDGLVQVAVTRFSSAGWAASDGGRFVSDIPSTTIYYDPAVSGAEAAALRLRGQFPAIHRVAPRFSGLPAGPVVVLLASDYS